jgi:hypothetical protein
MILSTALTVQRRYNYELTKLRELGWAIWDPIGLVNKRRACEDEYDQYLLEAVSKVSHEVSEATVIAHLVQIETEHMGLGQNATASIRARALVIAIQSYLNTLL